MFFIYLYYKIYKKLNQKKKLLRAEIAYYKKKIEKEDDGVKKIEHSILNIETEKRMLEIKQAEIRKSLNETFSDF